MIDKSASFTIVHGLSWNSVLTTSSPPYFDTEGKPARFNLFRKSLTNNKFAHKPDKSRKLNRPLSRQIILNNVVNGLRPGLVLKQGRKVESVQEQKPTIHSLYEY